MNSQIFNPNDHTVRQWIFIYLNQTQINQFEEIIDRTSSYLSVISQQKLKRINSMSSPQTSPDNSPTLPPLKKKGRLKRKTSIRDEGGIEQFIEQVNTQKQRFQEEYQQAIKGQPQPQSKNNKTANQLNQGGSQPTDSTSILRNKIQVCEKHLTLLKSKCISFYDQFLQQQNQLVENFFKFKMFELKKKYKQIVKFLEKKNSDEFKQVEEDVRVLFDNLYIETEYLRLLLHKNIQLFDHHSQNDENEETQVKASRDRQFFKLKNMEKDLEELKKQIRQLYFDNYRKKKTRSIKNHHKLEQFVKKQIAVNADQYQPLGTRTAWMNGFMFAFLIVALIAIIIFRQTNISELENTPNYRIQFTVWRGASYLIFFNWVVAAVTFVWQTTGINYRNILMQDGFVMQKYQSFIWTASFLSAIYLSLFLVYLLKELNYIIGNQWLSNLGYYMWLINIVFMLNPLKVMNWKSRQYFLYMFVKNLVCLFTKMNMNIFFLGLIIGSFAQPMNDMVFTLCSLKYHDEKLCQEQGRVGTYIFMMIFFFYRSIQSIRLHVQFGQGKYCSRANIGHMAVIFGANGVTSSFVYGSGNNSDYTGVVVYFYFSMVLMTLFFIQADFRADWGIILLDEQDPVLRRFIHFQRKTFLFWCIVDTILNVGWILTISNNTRAFLNINVLYFFMVLAYVQFARKGIWMTFRIEDDHAVNTGNLRAMYNDDIYWEKVREKLVDEEQNKVEQRNDSQMELDPPPKVTSKFQLSRIQPQNIEEAPFILQNIQEMVLLKKQSLQKVRTFIESLEGYLNIVHKIYQKLNWEDQF